MSEPSYRINTERQWSSPNPWEARITRLSDGEHVQTVTGDTEPAALAQAQGWIEVQHADPIAEGRVYFASETGEITEGATA